MEAGALELVELGRIVAGTRILHGKAYLSVPARAVHYRFGPTR
jgi:hypothetical protein